VVLPALPQHVALPVAASAGPGPVRAEEVGRPVIRFLVSLFASIFNLIEFPLLTARVAALRIEIENLEAQANAATEAPTILKTAIDRERAE
jgi:hypothetical protein